ncbi:hypothetical protein TSAR_016633 [Trichomalopsis sarcophagae]|uniref:Uncharacterized protein n=1 Tax=Trichomalopsis sarcophagae TaxID=543379 RepID=A0A232EMX1_9HYME|nr:hypothetical protein TSAR_016633 [Trichomalopsis sarcophagae]
MASFDNSLIDQVCAMTDAQYNPEELDTILHELQSRTATEPTATITTSDVPEREICAAYFDPDMIPVLTEAIGDQCEEAKNSPSNDASEAADIDSSAFGNDSTSAAQQQEQQQQQQTQQRQPKQQQQEQPQELQIFQDILSIDEGVMHNQHTDSLRVHKKMLRHHERLSSGADQTYRADCAQGTQAFYTSSLEFLEPFKKLELVQTLQRIINRSVACINTAVTDSCLRKGHMFMFALARKILDENAAICTPPLMTLSSSRFINSIRIVTDGCIDKKNLPRVTRIEAYRLLHDLCMLQLRKIFWLVVLESRAGKRYACGMVAQISELQKRWLGDNRDQ